MFELVAVLLNVTDTVAGGTAIDETDDDTEETDGVLLVEDKGGSREPLLSTAGIFFSDQLLSKLNSVSFPTMVEAAEIEDECDSEDGMFFFQDSGVNAPESLSPIVKLVAVVTLLLVMGISLDLNRDEGVSVVERVENENFLGISVSEEDLLPLFELESSF